MESLGIIYLQTVATISLTFVGFSSIVVVFRQVQGNRLDEIHVFLVRFFIEMGFIITAFSLLPLLLGVWGMPAGLVWRYASAVFAVVHLGYVVILFQRRRNAAGTFSSGRNLPLILVSIGVDASLILNALGWPFPANIGPYVLALTWGLLVAGFFFIQTLEAFLS
ncbi:MAG TPA: hypothetical protein VMT91_09785 [Anaerolineales bacterium]|nr:hypothetical protein [Anaerolineales bacterium]